jgi:hypothetical protein
MIYENRCLYHKNNIKKDLSCMPKEESGNSMQEGTNQKYPLIFVIARWLVMPHSLIGSGADRTKVSCEHHGVYINDG